MQVCIAVLGMHRSGTSALGGVLHALGISMGQTLVEAKKHNPKGYFENKKIIDFNDYVLFPALEQTWDDLSLLPEGWEEDEKVRGLYAVAKEIIRADYSEEKLFGIKDPRLCILFPFWEKVLRDLNIEIKVILPYRNPEEIYRSLQKRDGFSREKTFLMWVKYVLLAEYYSRKYPRVAIAYYDLLGEPKETVKKIFQRLSVDVEDMDSKIDHASRFVEEGLKHYNGGNSLVAPVPIFVQETNELYLQLIAGDPGLEQAFDRVREEYMTNTSFFLHDNKEQIEKKFKLHINNRKLSHRLRNRLRPIYELYKHKMNKD
ncbi:sulfotransferase family protein [Thiomicrolovo sp. ZZH C-3]